MRALYILLLFFFASCGEKETPIPDIKAEGIRIVENIQGDVIWSNENVYILSGRITVVPGSTLTIEPGTIIKGESGSGANAASLLISRGARIYAEGTAQLPIIFTSIADEITPEDVKLGIFESPNLRQDITGLWGGLIVLGNAPISASTETSQIEGIPTSDYHGLYGGSDSVDNSGVLKYISIRHGGTNIGSGNEINGLTLGGVGSNTVVENIEIVANQDDGIELFGGTVNVRNLVVWNVGDDAIDTDQAWSGTIDNFLVVSPQGHCFELDGPEGILLGKHTIKNGSVIASHDIFYAIDLINTDENSRVSLENIYFTEILPGQKINRTFHPDGEVDFIDIFLNTQVLQDCVTGDVPENVHLGGNSQIDSESFSWSWVHFQGIFQILQ
jgi:hypothetical protein